MAVKTAQVTATNEQALSSTQRQQLREALGIVDESKVFIVRVNEHSVANVVEAFNTSTQIFNIRDVSGVHIMAIRSGFENGNFFSTSRVYKLISHPAGQVPLKPGLYGNNFKQIELVNLKIVKIEQDSTSQDIEETINTVLDLGDIGTSSVEAHINNSTTIRTIANFELSTTLIKSIISGNQTDYIYKGSGGTYGNGQNDQLVAGDLQLVNQETEGIPDNSIAEAKLTQAVRDKLNTLQATPETLATASQITVPLDRVMGTDFTGTVTDIENFVINTSTTVHGGYVIYAIQTSAEPTITGAVKQVFMSDQENWDNTQIYTLHIWKESSQVNYNIVKRNV